MCVDAQRGSLRLSVCTLAHKKLMIRDMQRRYLSMVRHPVFSLPRNHSYADASKDEHHEIVLSSVRYIT